MTPQIEDKGFENYYKEKMIHKWRKKYFPYSDVKAEITQKYKNFLHSFEKEGKKKTSGVEVVFFGDNETYLNFINDVDGYIKTEFSKVKKKLL